LYEGDEARVLVLGLDVADELPTPLSQFIDLAGPGLTDMRHELLDAAGRIELDANVIALVSPASVWLAQGGVWPGVAVEIGKRLELAPRVFHHRG
jgi:hypothetical protein